MVSLTPVAGSPFSTGAAGSHAWSVAFHPNGKALATANNLGSSVQGSVSLFEVLATGSLKLVTPPVSTGADEPTSVAFSPIDALLAAGNFGSGSVSLFLVETVPPYLKALPISPVAIGGGQNPCAVAFHPKQRPLHLFAADFTNNHAVSVFVLTDPPTGWVAGTPVSFPTGVPTAVHDGGPLELAFHPTGKYLATANAVAGSVSLFLVNDAGRMTLQGLPIPIGTKVVVNSLAFSPNGQFLATGIGPVGNVQMLKFSTTAPHLTLLGSPFSTGANNETKSVAFNPAGDLLAVANGSSVSLFGVHPTGALTLVAGSPFSIAGDLNPRSVAFSPNGKLLAVGSESAPVVSMFTVT
jgi:WD40 repeat protein